MKIFLHLVLVLSSTGLTRVWGQEPTQRAEEYCYALQASLLCDELKMRVDTQAKVEEKAGGLIRGPESAFKDGCMTGLMNAYADQDEGELCQNAWRKFGCDGTAESSLIQQNPRAFRFPVLCEYQ